MLTFILRFVMCLLLLLVGMYIGYFIGSIKNMVVIDISRLSDEEIVRMRKDGVIDFGDRD